MNLICFPHYTCGGLLSDILNETFSTVGTNGGIQSINHSLGKIGDSATTLTDYETEFFMEHLKKLNVEDSAWIGTHCWPGKLNLKMFNQVIIVTTTTFRSKLYRWTRAYYHYYFQSAPWAELTGQPRIDKERETAKNYLVPFMPVHQPGITNIEFAEIVEQTVEFKNLIHEKALDCHMDRWQRINKFLYDTNIWASDPFKRFYEAELETQLSKYYVYK
jgi:hypothetical protein